jgi:hypothetical protein
MTYLVSGKILETIGAVFVAYVAIRACVLEMIIGRHLRRRSMDIEMLRRKAEGIIDRDVERLRDGLERILEQRHRQFGFYQALLVGSGTMFVAIGCALYLVGVVVESH